MLTGLFKRNKGVTVASLDATSSTIIALLIMYLKKAIAFYKNDLGTKTFNTNPTILHCYNWLYYLYPVPGESSQNPTQLEQLKGLEAN